MCRKDGIDMCGGRALCNALLLSQGDGVYRCPHFANVHFADLW